MLAIEDRAIFWSLHTWMGRVPRLRWIILPSREHLFFEHWMFPQASVLSAASQGGGPTQRTKTESSPETTQQGPPWLYSQAKWKPHSMDHWWSFHAGLLALSQLLSFMPLCCQQSPSSKTLICSHQLSLGDLNISLTATAESHFMAFRPSPKGIPADLCPMTQLDGT